MKTKADAKRLKVLILEDVASDAELIQLSLMESELDCEFKLAKNQEQFESAVKTFKPDIILSDFWLQGYTGLKALDFVQKNAPDTPFVLVTGTLGEEKAVETILKGASDFLLKDHLGNLPAAVLRSMKMSDEKKARIQAVSKLERSESHFRGLIENSQDPILVFDEDSIISYASPAVKRILGYSSGEIIGNSMPDFLHPDDRANREELFRELLKGKRDKIILRHRFKTKSGKYMWMESIISDQRKITGVGAIVDNMRNIDENVKSEQRIQQKNLLLDSVMNNLSEGVVVSDKKGKIILFNSAAGRILGFRKKNSLDKEWSNIKGIYYSESGEEYPKKKLPLYRATNGDRVVDEEMFLKNELLPKGTYLNVNATPLPDDKGKLIGGVISFSDISQKKHYQNELEKTLESLEQMVEERTLELKNALQGLNEAHKHIKYSINYAKRLQQAIITSKEEILKVFNAGFMMFLPKDVVSGDYVWMNNGDSYHLAVADCTGHGVPGAMMSMIGNELLERIIVDRQIHRPEIILEELDKSVSNLFRNGRNNNYINDGMDLSLCSFDFDNNVLSFAGAHNNGLLFHQKDAVILEANRFSIGGFKPGKYKEFNRTIREFEKGDRLYMFTDGFQDQFGGPRSKKFTKKRLIELIGNIQNHTMAEQESIIQTEFDGWKGNEGQVDDVTMVGIEL